jgi:hypothetical protein
LFRYDLEAVQRTELLIIMTPRIVRTEADADRVKQAEAARMSWCLADVKRLHGDPGIVSRGGEWGDDQTVVIYPWPSRFLLRRARSSYRRARCRRDRC